MRRAKPGSPAGSAADFFTAASTRGPLSDAHMSILMEASSGWNSHVEALQALSKTTKAVCSQQPPTARLDALLNQIRHIAPKLPTLVADLRSSLVKEACETLQILAALLGPPFVALVDVHVVPILLKRACTTKAVIRDSAVAAASALLEHGLSAISPHVISHISAIVVEGKVAVAMRRVAATFLGIIAAHPALPSNPGLRDALELAIANGVADSDETVRATSRRNWLAYVVTNTTAAKALLDRIPLQITHLILRQCADELPAHFTSSSPSASPERPLPASRPKGPSRRVVTTEHVATSQSFTSPPRPSRVARPSFQPNIQRGDRAERTERADLPPRPSRVARASLAPNLLRAEPPLPPPRPSRVARASLNPVSVRAEQPPFGAGHLASTLEHTTTTSLNNTAGGALAQSRNPFPPPPKPPALRTRTLARPPRRSLAPGTVALLNGTTATSRSFHMEPPTPIADALSRAKAEVAGTRPSAAKPPSPAKAAQGTTAPVLSPALRAVRSPINTSSKTSEAGHSRNPVVSRSPQSTSSSAVSSKGSTEQKDVETAVVTLKATSSPVKVSKAAMDTARTLLRSPAKSPTAFGNAAAHTPPSGSRLRYTPPTRPSPASVSTASPGPSPSRKRSGDDVAKPPSPERLFVVRRALRKPMRRITIQPIEKEPASKSARKSSLPASSSPNANRSPVVSVMLRPKNPSPARENLASQDGAPRSRKRVNSSPATTTPPSAKNSAESPGVTRKQECPDPSSPETAHAAAAQEKYIQAHDEKGAIASPQGPSDSVSSEPTSSNESVPEPENPGTVGQQGNAEGTPPTLDASRQAALTPSKEAVHQTQTRPNRSTDEASRKITTPEEDQGKKLRLSFIIGENKTPAKPLRGNVVRLLTPGTDSAGMPEKLQKLPTVPGDTEESATKADQVDRNERRGISVPDFDFDEEDDDDATVADEVGEQGPDVDDATQDNKEKDNEDCHEAEHTPPPVAKPTEAAKPKKEEELVILSKEEVAVGKTEETVVSVGATTSPESNASVSGGTEKGGQTEPSEPRKSGQLTHFSSSLKREDVSPAKKREDAPKEKETGDKPMIVIVAASAKRTAEKSENKDEKFHATEEKCAATEDEAPSSTVLDVTDAAPSSSVKASDGSRHLDSRRRVDQSASKSDKKKITVAGDPSSVVDLKEACVKKSGGSGHADKKNERPSAPSEEPQKKDGPGVVSAPVGKPPTSGPVAAHAPTSTARVMPLSRRTTRRSVMATRHARASIAQAKLSSAQMRASIVGGNTAASGFRPGGGASRAVPKASAGISRAFSGIAKSSVGAKSVSVAGRGGGTSKGGGGGGGSGVKTSSSPGKVEAMKRAASVPARVGMRGDGAKSGGGGGTGRKVKGERSTVDELRSAVGRLRGVSGRTRGTWKARLEAVQAVTERLKSVGGESVPGQLGEECVALIGEALHDVHHRVTMAGLDGMFFVLLCTTGSEDGSRLQRVLEKRPEIVRRVLQLLRDGREDVRLGGGRVMQSFEVQFSAEVQVGLVLRAMSSGTAAAAAAAAVAAAGAGGPGAGAGPIMTVTVDERVGEMGCVQLVRAFERAERCEGGFMWTSAMLQRVVTMMAALRKDRRVDVRRGADAVVAAMRKCLPDGAFEMACRKFHVSL